MSADLQEQYDRVYRYCYFKVRDAALAEDLAQETFLHYFSQHTYIHRGKQMAYLYTIARNQCIDAFRRQKNEPLPETAAAPDALAAAELQLALRDALDTLPAAQRELLLLRYVNALSVGEIAAITGQSRFAVYRQCRAALTILNAHFDKEDFL